MRGLFTALILSFALSSTAYSQDRAICYSGDIAYSIEPPKDWIIDTEFADKLGICAIYVPKGYTFEDSAFVIYPRITESDKKGMAAIKEIIDDAAAQLKKFSKDFKLRERPDYTNTEKLKFTVRDFLNGPQPNEYETVAYLSTKNTVYLVVLSARSQKELDASRPKFIEALNTVKPVSPKDLEKLKSKAPPQPKAEQLYR